MTQKSHLIELAEYNVFGRALLLINDALPSAVSFSNSYNLCHGKSITLSDPYVDNQRFINRVHLLTITDDKASAQTLSSWLKVPLIDLSAYEQVLPAAPELSLEEKSWLLTVLPLCGAMKKSSRKTSAKAQPRRAPVADDSLSHFLSDCCAVGGAIPAAHLFLTYCAYYEKVHNTPFPGSRIMFTKGVKARYKDTSSFTYRQTRLNTTVPLWQFVGIHLKPNWADKITPAPAFTIPDDFLNFLWSVHCYIPQDILPKSPETLDEIIGG